jgi:hypothetical protein
MLYNESMTNHADSQLARKLARAQAGLAPEDQTFAQAQNTGRLRQQNYYIQAWLDFEAQYNQDPDTRFDGCETW